VPPPEAVNVPPDPRAVDACGGTTVTLFDEEE
jgi:hypothetical protein